MQRESVELQKLARQNDLMKLAPSNIRDRYFEDMQQIAILEASLKRKRLGNELASQNYSEGSGSDTA